MAEIDGLADAKKAIEELTSDMRKKVVIAALKAAGRPMLLAARQNAPVAMKATRRVIPGLLRRSFGTFTSKIKKASSGEVGVYIRPRTIAKVRKAKRAARRAGVKGPNFGDPFYYRFLEKGTKYIKAMKFIGRAFESQTQNAVGIFTAAIKKRIDKANARKP
jgi:HK97 gp10 family phage protein